MDSRPHPDDLIRVTVSLEFRGTINPNAEDPAPLIDVTTFDVTASAAGSAAYMMEMVGAIRERRLYGFLVQQVAEAAVGSGEWIDEAT